MESTAGTLFVVVGVDGSPSSETALSWAVRAAARRSLPLRVVHVPSPEAHAVAWGRDLVDARMLRAREAQVRAEGVVQAGDPVRVLSDQAGDAALVVLGAIGQSGPRHLRLGSVADHLIQQARCPVIVTPQAPCTTDRRVVVGLDASGGSERALTFAFEEASLQGMDLTIVIARGDADVSRADASDEPGPTDGGLGPYTDDLQLLRQTYPSVVVNSESQAGNAVRVLVEHARDAELLVVGARRHEGVPGIDHASVSHAVLLHAACAVAIVHDWTTS
jgi:nucleotide-binding universal stress UspA family protein